MTDNSQPPVNFIHYKLSNVDKIKQIYLKAFCRHVNKLQTLDDNVLLPKLAGCRRTKRNAIKRMKGGFFYVWWWN
ncbi:MAG: hypothetical protein E7035_07115 [Verrucomicrobiaceae bacterium]|nr:hypothetical protein [Verrucomicrobiaceae bacterium]